MTDTEFRDFFPIFATDDYKQKIYFDNAATSFKLQSVIDETQHYYQQNTSNVHRSSHKSALAITEQYEAARCTIQKHIGASSAEEIVWTAGATASINLVADCLKRGAGFFKAGDEITLSELEHHSNIVPWQQVALALDLVIKVMPVDKMGVIDLQPSLAQISDKTALVAIGHVSNALGNINPIQAIIDKAKYHNALTLVDGTQAVAHLPVDVQALDCDFYVFSGHKMFGPTGIGVLYGKSTLLASMPPYQTGGEMVKQVSLINGTSFQNAPLKFEAGTPNVAGVLGLAAASQFIQAHLTTMISTEKRLYSALLHGMQTIAGVTLWGHTKQSIGVVSFTVTGINIYDLGVLLDKRHIAIRVGHHCAMPLMQALGITGTLRVSLAAYNTLQEVNTFINELSQCIDVINNTEQSPSEQNTPLLPAEIVATEHRLGPIAVKIQGVQGWDMTYRELMFAGKNMQRMTEHDKTSDTEVFGCESQVWVKCSFVDNQLVLAGDSASKIVRGLMVVIFEALQGLTAQQVRAFQLTAYLKKLGLAKHLSQSRGNGLAAMVEKIMKFCEV